GRARCRAAQGAGEPTPPCGGPSLTRKARLPAAVPPPLFTVRRLTGERQGRPGVPPCRVCSCSFHRWLSLVSPLRGGLFVAPSQSRKQGYYERLRRPCFLLWSVAPSLFAAKGSDER
ncbi:MAG: hypothetical protein N6V49_02015, partial [Serratia symbiotica]|nr:hypothetical protein [Serratia symbiotica]